MKTGLEQLKDYAATLFTIRVWPKVSEWVCKNVWLPKISGRKPGWYSLARNPAFAEILDTFSDRDIKYVYLCFGTQLGKTTLLLAILCYNIVYRKFNTLWVFPNKHDGNFLAETRWKPMLEACKPAVAELLKHRGANNKDKQIFVDCFVRFVGSFSKTSLQSTPAELMFFDEVDNLFEGRVDDEEVTTSALVSGTDRLKDSPDGKAYYSGSPKSPKGPIWAGLESGDFRQYFMPSPHAPDKEWITFTWGSADSQGGIKWDQTAKDEVTGEWDMRKVIDSVYYSCPHTGLPITMEQKEEMLRKGKWVATNPKADPQKRSYHMSSLYADYTWEKIVREYFDKKATPGGFIQFINGWLAEPYRPKAQYVSDEMLLARSHPEFDKDGKPTFEPYLMGTIKGDERVLMGCDVQKDHIWYIVRGFDRDRRTSYLIDYGKVSHFDDLDPIYVKYNVRGLVIDTGHRTSETLQAILYYRTKLNRNWWGIKGFGVKSTGTMRDDQPIRVHHDDPYIGTKKGSTTTVPVIHSNNPIWYDDYFKNRNGTQPGFHLPTNVDAEYIRQSLNVRSEEKVDARGKKTAVVDIKGDDHLPDCERYVFALANNLNCYGRFYTPPIGKPTAKAKKPARKFWFGK